MPAHTVKLPRDTRAGAAIDALWPKTLALVLGAAGLLGCATATGPSHLFSLPDVTGQRTHVYPAEEGELVVLIFWATWCRPCQEELRRLDGVYQRLAPHGLKLYAISIDDPDTLAQVRSWASREDYRFPVLLDTETRVLARYHQVGEIPYYVVIDSTGQVIDERQAFNFGYVEQLEGFLAEYLSAPARTSAAREYPPATRDDCGSNPETAELP